MDAETLKALQGSIAKWEQIVAGAPANSCPLCELFNSSLSITKNDCKGCPVFASTKKRYCSGTPYKDWGAAMDNEDSELAELAAQAELDFLKSLLPTEVPL